MKKIVLANWKAHLGPGQAADWVARFTATHEPVAGVEVVLAVPDLCMQQVHSLLQGIKGISLAAQAVSPYPPGSYTGATPALWYRDVAGYALVGHQERRRYFHEDVQTVAAQARESVAAGLRPVVCVDHAGAAAQVAALDSGDIEQGLFAYTPQEAVSLEKVREFDEIGKMANLLAELTGGRPVLYGGGVDRDNAAAIAALPGISGVMVGRACLDPAGFAALVRSLAA